MYLGTWRVTSHVLYSPHFVLVAQPITCLPFHYGIESDGYLGCGAVCCVLLVKVYHAHQVVRPVLLERRRIGVTWEVWKYNAQIWAIYIFAYEYKSRLYRLPGSWVVGRFQHCWREHNAFLLFIPRNQQSTPSKAQEAAQRRCGVR